MRVGTLRSMVTGVVVAVATLAGTSQTFAQPGGGRGPGGGMFGGGMGEALQPTINSREFTRVSKVLNLDKDQEEAAKLLYDGFEEQLRKKADPLRTKMERAREDFRENRDPSVWQDLRGEFEKFRPMRDQMEQGFLTDLKGLLREEQGKAWPKFERGLRREQSLGRGLMSGERVDLVKIVEGAGLSDEAKAALAGVLDQYEQDLDRELSARTAFQKENMPKMGELFQSGDTAKMQEMMDKGRELSVRVREVNRKYARQIEDLSPEDKRAAIADEVKKQSYPRVYNKTRASRLLDSAIGMKDLTEDQKTGLEAIKSSYERDLGAVNEDLSQATEKFEMTMKVEDMMSFWRGGGDDGPLGELNRKRGSLNRKAEDEVRKILTPEQAAKLPKEDDNNNDGRRRWDRGGDRNNGNGGGDRPPRATPRQPNDRL